MQRAFPRGAPHAPAAVAVIAAAILMGACSKGESQAEKPRPNAPFQAPQAPVVAPRVESEVDAALKERLARQEAASKMFVDKKAAPAPAPAAPPPEPKQVETKRAEPAKAAAAPPPPAPKAEPQKTYETTKLASLGQP